MRKRHRAWFGKYRNIIFYLFFGALTTLINLLVYYPLYNALGLSALLSNICAWAAAVTFAFLTNKAFVFKSHDWSASVVFPELWRFTLCRLGSGGLETGLLFLLADVMGFNGNAVKLIASVLVVIWNYFASKLLVFRKIP